MVTTSRASSRSQFRSRDENVWLGLEVRNSVSTDPEAITISVSQPKLWYRYRLESRGLGFGLEGMVSFIVTDLDRMEEGEISTLLKRICIRHLAARARGHRCRRRSLQQRCWKVSRPDRSRSGCGLNGVVSVAVSISRIWFGLAEHIGH